MCGIAGFVKCGGFNLSAATDTLKKMTGIIAHRGPDDDGHWFDPEAGVALGHRRLSILDLSPLGHQPMASACGRYLMVYNGEIYNHHDLRRDLEAEGVTVWRGHSDTEVILAAIAQWGFHAALPRLNGMFAFALWDRREHQLYLARDRFGEKPLYYGNVGGQFVFGSELKSFRQLPGWTGKLNREALWNYLHYCYVPAPYSIYEGIFKLTPGHFMAVDVKVKASDLPSSQAYWRLQDAIIQGRENPWAGTEDEALDAMQALLFDAVGRRMESDVPLGAFLSGGVDSSMVVALMQAQSGKPVQTFTIGFEDRSFNEADHAKAVAQHLGTNHTELYVTSDQALAVVPHLPHIYDEPFADSSQIPTFLVSKLARSKVTVSLSGDGGDELFGGYNRYFQCQKLWQVNRRAPRFLRQGAAAAILATPPGWIDFVAAGIPRIRNIKNFSDKLQKLALLLQADSMAEVYQYLLGYWHQPDAVLQHPNGYRGAPPPGDFINHPVEAMMVHDSLTYLPDDILVKVDRASMAVSLEGRVPLLDHRIAELAWRLPLSMKVRNGGGKWALRQILYRYVPQELIDRPKMGFGVPVGDWMRGPLRDWAESLLSPERIARQGVFDPAVVQATWAEHLSGKRNWQNKLWVILMFEAWAGENGLTL